MTINLSNRLSSITKDSAGVTHIVWVEDATLFHATYDDNSATWINRTAIASVGSQKIVSLNLIANDNLIEISNSTNKLPGLAVVYQQGSENESNIFYTAAQYDASGKTQWLDKPQALTADQVGDLEPRAIATDDGTIFVVGQKVNTDNVTNQAIREDTDLYYQSFNVSSSQFTTSAESNSLSSSATLRLQTNVLGYSGQNQAVAASYSPLSNTEAATLAQSAFNGQELNWEASSNFSPSALEFIFSKGTKDKVRKTLKNAFGGLSLDISLQGSSGNNPNWSLFGGGVSTDGKLLLNAVASLSYAKASDKKTPLQRQVKTRITTNNQTNAVNFSVTLSSLYTYGNKKKSTGKFPLVLETGSLGLSFAFTFPIVGGVELSEFDTNLFSLNAFLNAGITLQWQLNPKDPNTYQSILFPYINDNDSTAALLVGDSFATLPGFSQFAAINALLADIIVAFESIDNQGPLSLESLLIAIPIQGGVELNVDIPFVFKLKGSVGVFLDGTFLLKGTSDSPKDTFTLGLPYSLAVQVLGLINAKIGGFPTWTWPESSSESLTSNNSAEVLSATGTLPTVEGSLLTIPFSTSLNPDLNLNPEEFTVQVMNPDGTQSTIPVFAVIVEENAVILRLEQSIPYTILNDQPLTDNITVSYSGTQPLNGFTESTVINNSAQTLVYTYDPTSGTGDNYANSNQQITIVFNTPLNTDIVPDSSQFVVTDSDGTVINLIPFEENNQNPIYVNQNTVILTLEGTIPSGENYTVQYTPVTGANNNLESASNQDITSFTISNSTPSTTAGNINTTFISAESTNQVLNKIENDFAQDSPPTLALTSEGDILLGWSSDAPNLLPISALAQGSNIYLTFGENLANNQGNYLNPTADQFIVVIDGVTQSLSATQLPSVEGNTLVLTLDQPIADNATTISVDYNLVASEGDVSSNLAYIDLTGTTFWLEEFTDLPVDLINESNSPTVLNLEVNGTIYNGYALNQTIVIPFDQELLFTSENNQIPSDTFTVLVDGQGVGVLQAIINDTSVVLTLDNSIQIGQGNTVSVDYISDPDNPLKGINDQVVASFSLSSILTTATNSGTVIKTAFSPFGDSGISEIITVPGTKGLNFDVASALTTDNINVLAWVQVDNSDLIIQQIPGQTYTNEQIEQINSAISESDIYYSILGADNQWSLAQPIAPMQTGQDQKVTLGKGPNGDLIAAWLNTQQASNGDTETTIYWSSFNGTDWTTPQTLLSEISPNAFTELTISSINNQPAIFWTESQPASYSDRVLSLQPLVYLRLGELSGTTAINEGESAPSLNGTYSGNFTFNQIGALDDIANNSGDPNPAVLFNGGGVSLDSSIPVSIQGFSVEFWFKLPSLNAIPNLVSMADVFLFTVNDTQLSFSLDNSDNSTISINPPLDIDTWYYVVGTYDGTQDILSLYLNGELVGTMEDVSFANLPPSGKLDIVGQGGSVYVDEVAFYNSVLSYVPSSNSLTASNVTDLTGSQFLDGALGTNEIGNNYNAQYLDPVPAGPEAHYSVWNPATNSWQQDGQIEPTPAITPTILSDANYPIWDIVSATTSPTGTIIFPNGQADSIFQVQLKGEQNREITGISVTVSGTGLLWGVGEQGNGTPIGGYQVGVILGETVTNNNNQLAFAESATLLNSLNSNLPQLNHQIMGETEVLNLLIDETGNTFSETPTVTVYFKDGGTLTPEVTGFSNSGGTTQGTNDLGTQVLGIATVTEANDASLANIDSGFIIDTDNPAIASVLASAFNSNGSLAYVAVGNRGYTDSDGNLVSGGTIQILLPDDSVLKGGETKPLTTTDLSGNPGGVLITGIADSGLLNGGVSMSLATGDIDGDGVDDLVIGDANANNGNGAIYVIYGSYLTSNPGITIDVSTLTATPSSIGYAIAPNISDAQAGFSVIVGNFDGDSKFTRNDIAFGAPGVGDGGAVYVAYNGLTSFTPVYTGTNSERAGFALGVSHHSTENPTTFTGSSTSDDLFIGSPAYQVEVANQWKGKGGLPSGSQSLYPDSTSIGAGAVHVFSSGNNGFSQWATYTGPNVPAANGVAANYLAGGAIASEDLNGDGRQDLAISATGVNANAGAVYIINGDGATQNVQPQTVNDISNLIINGSIVNGKAGTVISAPGDLNGDGYQDFLITAPQASNGTGQSYLLFGPLNLTEVGTSFDLGVTSQDKTFLLNGNLPYQLAGSAAIGLGNITSKKGSNNQSVDSLLITAPNAQQVYAVYGQPYLEDDGSIKLANIASDNGFVIDGNSFSTFNVVNPEIPNQATNLMPSLVSHQGTLYMAVKGEGSSTDIYITTSTDGGITWSPATVAIAGATNFSPSLAVYNDVLYLAYTGLDPQLNILASTDGGQTWSPQSVIGQTSNNSPTLVVYQDQLFTFFTADNQTDSILYIYSDNPLETWSSNFAVTFSGGNQTSASAVSATVFDGALYLAYQTGTQSSPGNTFDITSTNGADLNNLSWAIASIPNIVSNQPPALTSDGTTLYLTNTTGYTLTLTEVGSLVLLSPTGEQVWEARNSNNEVITGANIALMQDDGNFVLYANTNLTNPLWATATNRGSVNYLQLGSDGGLYIIDSETNTVLVTLYDNNGTANPNNSSNAKLEEGSQLLLRQTLQSGNSFISIYDGVGTGEPVWTTVEISGNSNYAPPPTIVDNKLYLVNSIANAGYQVLDSSLPPFSLSNNGNIVQMLGDINGDGFADVFSGGSNAGVIIFGDSTKDLLTEASTSDDLIITVQGADIQDVINIDDFNGDGLGDFGVIDSEGNFYIILGNPDLGETTQLTLTDPVTNVSSIESVIGIGKWFNNGYDDLLVVGENPFIGQGINLFTALGNNQETTFFSESDLTFISSSDPQLKSTGTGIDYDGDGSNNLLYSPSNESGFSNRSFSEADLFGDGKPVLTVDVPSPSTINQLQSIGDFNGDGIEDLAVFVNDYIDGVEGKHPQAILIYYGNANGLTNSSQPDLFFAYSDPNSSEQISTLAQAGDVNGDGFDDFLVSSSNSNNNKGSVIVVFGGDSSLWQPIQFGIPFPLEGINNSYGFVIEGLPNSEAGTSISGGDDVNGDGFDDFMIGAPGNNDELSYVLFGSDFNQTVNQTGTIGDDVMLGTPTGESFVAGQGDDQIYANGGLDVVYAGTGDDFVSVADTYFRRLDGGAGLDVLELHGYNGQDWDITTLAPGVRVQDFEVINILDYGANTLTLNSVSVTNLLSNNTLIVLMDSVDSLILSDDFSSAGTTYQYGDKYYQYTSDISAAIVLVNQANAPTYTAPSNNRPAPILPSVDEDVSLNSLSDFTSDSPSQSLLSNPNAPTQLFVSNPKSSENQGSVDFKIERTGNLDKYVEISYLTQDGRAKSGRNYNSVAGKAIFSPGESTITVSVPLILDDVYTGTRDFGLLVTLEEESFNPLTNEFHLSVDSTDGQIRNWNHIINDQPLSVIDGQLEFRVTTTDGKGTIKIYFDCDRDFNSYYAFNNETQTYQAFEFNGDMGAELFDEDNDGHYEGVILQVQDGSEYDLDGAENGIVLQRGFFAKGDRPLVTLNQPMYRFRNTSYDTGVYLYAGTTESVSIRENYPNFVEEGLAFYVSTTPQDGLIAFNRFQNMNLPGAYLYAGESESESIRRNYPNFVEEGIAFYAYPQGSQIADQISRFQNSSLPGTYLYTGQPETDSVINNYSNFNLEGIAFEAILT
ncbi:Calx-beta domain-containing protein [Cyanobacterium sp. DS4]|uniref:Calx-beta domain-containing protein n=1 Tax=Cyanobacterium sp. DS4 TaxID=2878255 RepID=UPI002E814701|nr:SwmB domain-containing protein [Cyanobacterium sp. Dongsha4]WVL00571.1 FG-GAP-like repeat-containing protein [Cyanobacterium sp. Dongsha4]